MALRVVENCFLCEKKVWQTPSEAALRAENPRLQPMCEECAQDLRDGVHDVRRKLMTKLGIKTYLRPQ